MKNRGRPACSAVVSMEIDLIDLENVTNEDYRGLFFLVNSKPLVDKN